MSRGRTYSIQFNNVAVAAVQDLLAAYAGGSMIFELAGLVIGQITGTTVQNLRFTVKRLPATVTTGSGGASATPKRMMRGDTAATITGRTNDTTQASTSGTADVLHSDVFNTVNGYQWYWNPQDCPTIGLNEAAVVSLDAPPGAAMTMSGTLYVRELL
jgi:hypothetical protein